VQRAKISTHETVTTFGESPNLFQSQEGFVRFHYQVNPVVLSIREQCSDWANRVIREQCSALRQMCMTVMEQKETTKWGE
jgi:hypothetical protein